MYGDYVRELGQLVMILGEHTPVASLEPQHFALYVTRLSESRSLKARARKRAFALVKAMFIWGAGNGHCPLPEFGTALKAPIVTKQAIRKEKARAGVEDFSDRILTGAEIDKLVEHSQPNMAAMILLGVNTGLGPADIGRIRWRNIDFATGKLDYPRGKNGNDRIGYVWNRTRTALLELRKLRRTKAAYAKDGDNALIFVTRKGEAYYREEDRIEGGVVTGVKISNSVSITFGRLAKSLKLKGVTFYRLRHTFKTLGKRAKDRDALYLAMGHTDNSAAASYDHEEVSFKRTKRVALKVKGSLWPKPKAAGGSGSMRIGESVAA
jgi:integrase